MCIRDSGSNEHYGALEVVEGNDPKYIYGQSFGYGDILEKDVYKRQLLKRLLECGGYFIEADLPSPLMGYPGALGLDLTEEAGDFEKILNKVESAIVEKGGADHFGTWAYSYGYTLSAGLALHAKNVLDGKSELLDMDDVAAALQVYSCLLYTSRCV